MARQKIDWEKLYLEQVKINRKLAKRANQRLVRLEQAAEKKGMESATKYAYKSAVKDIKSLGKVTGKPRFKERIKLVDIFDANEKPLKGQALYKANVMKLRTQEKMMKEFLGSASSTIGKGKAGPEGVGKTIGIKAIWSKSTNTINERYLGEYDIKMSDNDMKRFFDSKKQAKLEKDYGSRRMFLIAAVMKKYNLKSNKRDYEKFVLNHADLSKYSKDELKAKEGEKREDYIDRVSKYVKYTDDPVLDRYVKDALKNKLNVDNLFI